MRDISVDFETFYSKDYSLRDMTTREYIMDPRFEPMLLGVVDEGEAFALHRDEIGRWVHSVDWSDVRLTAHNLQFDGAILQWHYGAPPPAAYECSMFMAQALVGHSIGSASLEAVNELFGRKKDSAALLNMKGVRYDDIDWSTPDAQRYFEYVKQDALDSTSIALRLRSLCPLKMRMVIHLSVRMYIEGKLEFDRPLLEKNLVDVRRRAEEALASAGVKDRSEIRSREGFAELLRGLGVEPPRKYSPANGQLTYAFSKKDLEFVELQAHPDERVRTLVEAKLNASSTLEETRTERFLRLSNYGGLHVPLMVSGAHTHRYSGRDSLNLQNLPRDSQLRHAIRAPKGYKLVVVDASQIEARILAWLAGCTTLVNAFSRGDDVYALFASNLYGYPVTKKDNPDERFIGKTCVAEGTLILTDRGQVPVEEVKICDRVWDGVGWVSHAGVVYQGEKEVICYDGLSATEDHGVLTAQGPLPFGAAASRMAKLLTSGDGGEAVRVGEDHIPEGQTPEESHLLVRRMYEMWRAEMDKFGQPQEGQVQGLPVVFANPIQALRSAWSEIRRNCRALYKPFQQALSEIWWQGYTAPVQLAHGLHSLGREAPSAPGLQGRGGRPNRQRRPLLPGQSPAGYTQAAGQQPSQHSPDILARAKNSALRVFLSLFTQLDLQTGGRKRPHGGADRRKVRVYDILNAGPRRRYTAANKLVFNCVLGLGYGTGKDKFYTTALLAGQNISYGFAESAVKTYRQAYPEIPMLWRRMDEAITNMVVGNKMSIGPIQFGDRHWKTSAGLQVVYPKLKIVRENVEGYIRDEKQFYRHRYKSFEKLYGAKMTENVVQHLAWLQIVDTQIKMHLHNPDWVCVMQVHDELVYLAPDSEADECYHKLMRFMCEQPDWASCKSYPIPLDAEGGVSDTYGEAK